MSAEVGIDTVLKFQVQSSVGFELHCCGKTPLNV